MEKEFINGELVSLNYYPWEGWGRHLKLIQDHIDFEKRSPYKIVLSNPYAINPKPGEKLIFLSTVETDTVDKAFVDAANEGIAVITPANWVKEVFSKSGIRVPIFVVPEGITNNTVYYPDTNPFTFLHFDATSEANRKGGDLVSQAFITAFGNMQNKVHLIMKGRNHQIPLVNKYNNIEYIFSNYTDKQMEYLWEKTNCFVFPSRGEGFGLPPLEAMAKGIPTILTNGSALQTFAEYGIPLRVSGKCNSVYNGSAGMGQWEKPDLEHLIELMQMVYENYNREKERAIVNAKVIWDKYDFSKVAPTLASTINSIIKDDISAHGQS